MTYDKNAVQRKYRKSAKGKAADERWKKSAKSALLCGRCNTLVGYIESSWDLLEPTFDYLAFHGSL